MALADTAVVGAVCFAAFAVFTWLAVQHLLPPDHVSPTVAVTAGRNRGPVVRGLNILFLLAMVVVSQWVIVAAIVDERYRATPALAIEFAGALVWLVYLLRHYAQWLRRPRWPDGLR